MLKGCLLREQLILLKVIKEEEKCKQGCFCSPPRVLKIITKVNKWDLVKLLRFCTAKEIINKMKRWPSKWEKMFANEVIDKGLIFKMYKQLMYLNIKKQIIKKWSECIHRNLPKKDRWPKKHMKTRSTSLIIREMQFSTTTRYHLTPVRMAIIKKIYKVGKVWRKSHREVMKSLSHVWLFANSWIVTYQSPQVTVHVGNSPWSFSGKSTGVGCHFLLQWRKRNPLKLLVVPPLWTTIWRLLLKLDLPYNPAVPLLAYSWRKTIIWKDPCTSAFIAALFTTATMWKQPNCLSTEEWTKWFITQPQKGMK